MMKNALSKLPRLRPLALWSIVLFSSWVGHVVAADVSKWFPQEKQGTALGFFGMGNVGAAVTKFVAPFVMVAMGWTAVGNQLNQSSFFALRRILQQGDQFSGLLLG